MCYPQTWVNVHCVSVCGKIMVQLSLEGTTHLALAQHMEDKCVAEWTNGRVALWWCVDDEVNGRMGQGDAFFTCFGYTALVLGRTHALIDLKYPQKVHLSPRFLCQSHDVSHLWPSTLHQLQLHCCRREGWGDMWLSLSFFCHSVHLVQQSVSSSSPCPDMNSQRFSIREIKVSSTNTAEFAYCLGIVVMGAQSEQVGAEQTALGGFTVVFKLLFRVLSDAGVNLYKLHNGFNLNTVQPSEYEINTTLH